MAALRTLRSGDLPKDLSAVLKQEHLLLIHDHATRAAALVRLAIGVRRELSTPLDGMDRAHSSRSDTQNFRLHLISVKLSPRGTVLFLAQEAVCTRLPSLSSSSRSNRSLKNADTRYQSQTNQKQLPPRSLRESVQNAETRKGRTWVDPSCGFCMGDCCQVVRDSGGMLRKPWSGRMQTRLGVSCHSKCDRRFHGICDCPANRLVPL